jgi:hypothetical protein
MPFLLPLAPFTALGALALRLTGPRPAGSWPGLALGAIPPTMVLLRGLLDPLLWPSADHVTTIGTAIRLATALLATAGVLVVWRSHRTMPNPLRQ